MQERGTTYLSTNPSIYLPPSHTHTHFPVSRTWVDGAPVMDATMPSAGTVMRATRSLRATTPLSLACRQRVGCCHHAHAHDMPNLG